jgi:hypothetical protein
MGQAEDASPFRPKTNGEEGPAVKEAEKICPFLGIFHALQLPRIARPDCPPQLVPVIPGCCKAKCEFWDASGAVPGCMVKTALWKFTR